MAESGQKLTAPVTWAQRNNTLFVTVDLPDVEKDSAKIDLSDEKLVFSGKSQGKDYEVELEFYKEAKGIDASSEESKYAIKPRGIAFLLQKKEEGFWPRLLENKQLQKTNVKADFDKWQDSDEEEEDFNADGMSGLGDMMGGMGGMPPGMGGMPPGMGGMGGMGGMPGMGGMGGMGGMDMEALMKQMEAMKGAAGEGDADEGDSDDGDDLPDLEEDEAAAAEK